MRRFAVVGAGLLSILATVGGALAADLPARPYTKAAAVMPAAIYDWSGLYIGVNGGGGGGRNCWRFVTARFDAGCHDVSGGMVGGHIGYNWQLGSAVLGLEGSGDWADISGGNAPALAPQGTDRSHISAIWMVTGRAGYAWDRALLYLRGGAAFVREDYARVCNGIVGGGLCLPVGSIAEFSSETRVGGVVGAGFEYAVTNNLILGLEGDYLPLGTRDIRFVANPPNSCGAGVGQPCTIAVKENLWTVTGRLSWKFGGPVVAKY